MSSKIQDTIQNVNISSVILKTIQQVKSQNNVHVPQFSTNDKSFSQHLAHDTIKSCFRWNPYQARLELLQAKWGQYRGWGCSGSLCHQGISIVQSSAVITWSNIIRYYMNNYRNCGRISIRCCIYKRHLIPCPYGQAMGCLLWIFVRKLTTY